MKKSVTGIALLLLAGVIAAAPFSGPMVKAEKHERTREFVPGRLLVKFKPLIDSLHARQVIAALGARDANEISGTGVHIVELPYQASENAFANAFQSRSEVEFAEFDLLLSPQQTVPNDPLFPAWYLEKIDAPTAWLTTTGSSNITIAILDTGVDATHADLAPKILPGRNIYDNNDDTRDVTGHGTPVAGVAGAASNNGVGVASVAWGCGIMPIRISDLSGMATASNIASGVSWAADHGARVANISYYVTGSKTISSAARYFQSKGGVVVAAAGNYGVQETTPDDPYVLTVGATDPQDVLYYYSNHGNNLDLVAPGNNTTTLVGGLYGAGGGTSFASPVVAGVAALMLSANPSLSPAAVVDMLKQSADDLGVTGWDPTYGSGRVNAARAVTTVAASPSMADTMAPSVSIASPQFGQRLTSPSTSVQVVVADNVRVVRNELYVDGVLVATSATAPFTTKWSSRKAAAGAHDLQCKAYDAAGNVGLSAPITVWR
jgi:subtilisin family serine protease